MIHCDPLSITEYRKRKTFYTQLRVATIKGEPNHPAQEERWNQISCHYAKHALQAV